MRQIISDTSAVLLFYLSIINYTMKNFLILQSKTLKKKRNVIIVIK